MPGFNVNIGGNAGQLTKTLGELNADLKSFKDQLSKATSVNDVVRLNQAIAQTQQQIKSISGAQNINAIDTATRNLAPGFQSAGFAIGNFGRIVQDAPFAFLQGNLIAIQNNIDPFIQSFIQLGQQSGGLKGAFSALGQSLAGPTGILLGINLVVSALTLFSAQAAQAKKEAEGFFKAQSEANKEAAGDLTRIKLLNSAATDNSRAMQERKDAATELVEKLKDLGVQTTQQAILEGRATEAIKQGTAAILERAQARAIENRITELSAKKLDNDLKLIDATTKLAAAENNLNNALKDRPQQKQTIAGTPTNIVSDPLILLAQSAVNDLRDEIKGLNEDSRKATDEIDKLFRKFKNQDITPEFKLPKLPKIKPELTGVELKPTKILTEKDFIKLPTQLVVPLKLGASDKVLTDISNFAQQAETILENSKLADALGLQRIPEDLNKNKAVLEDFAKTAKGLNEVLAFDQLLAKAQKVQDFLTGQLGPAFVDLFSTIATGGSNALEQFGQAIKGIVIRLAAAAATAAIFAAIITGITGGAAAGAPSFAKVFGNIFGGLGGFKFANGGIATSSIFGNVAETQPEAIMPLSRLPQIVNQINVSGSKSDGGGIYTIVGGLGELLFQIQKEQSRQGRTT